MIPKSRLCQLSFGCFREQCALCVIFLPSSIMDNEKMGRVPVPRSDSVRVAVRVRPFSQEIGRAHV